MENISLRFVSSKIFKSLKREDDSSGDEKATKGGGQTVKNLRSPRLKSKWPLHLEELRNELSGNFPETFEGPIKTAIQLLHALDVNEATCDALQQAGSVAGMVLELKAGTMRFGGELQGGKAFLASIFKLLIQRDVEAAQRLYFLCDATAKNLLEMTEEYKDIEALPPVPAFDRHQAKRETALYIDHVRRTLKNPKAYFTVLMPLIRGCPPSARDKVLRLLGKDKDFNAALQKSPKLAAAVDELQTISPTAKRQSEARLALLVVTINPAIDEMLNTCKGVSDFWQDERTVALFAEVENGLSEQQFDLQALIATLCPGEETTLAHTVFVAGLMKHLIQGAHAREKLFDFQGFLAATLHAGMPGRCARWLANSAVGTCRTIVDVGGLVEAIEQAGKMSRLDIANWMTLGLWADIVSGDIDNEKYIQPALKGELESTGMLDPYSRRLQVVKDKSKESISRLAAAVNKSGEEMPKTEERRGPPRI
jgi:hypothetical protein